MKFSIIPAGEEDCQTYRFALVFGSAGILRRTASEVFVFSGAFAHSGFLPLKSYMRVNVWSRALLWFLGDIMVSVILWFFQYSVDILYKSVPESRDSLV